MTLTPAWTNGRAWLYQGHDLDVLREMPDGVVQTIVTSPPYFGLRDYGEERQRGGEATPAAYVAGLVELYREARRVLRDDGTLWLNIGDAYAGKANAGRAFTKNRGRNLESVGYPPQRNMTAHAPYKSLLGMPWRTALALIDDGWILRNENIWTKPNAMPESVQDRFAGRHEHVFMFSKKRTYYFDRAGASERLMFVTRAGKIGPHPMGASTPGDVWTIPTRPFAAAHFATFPPEIPEIAIRAGSRPGDIVMDTASGSGTTGMVALGLGRRYVGIELSQEYIDLSVRTRFKETS